MNGSRLRARYRTLMGFFVGTTASFLFWDLVLARLGLRSLARRTRPARFRQAAGRFRRLAIRMGGVMIKVGQFLSSRLDVLPVEITAELEGLQDEVPPEAIEDIRRLAEAELGAPLEQIYERFEVRPMAAASLGQVHRAFLRADAPEEFRDVVVKIQRPFIDQIIDVDFAVLRRVAGWLNRFQVIRKHADVRALVEELASTVAQEIDYLAEGRNAETFQRNFSRRTRVHVPRVAWSRTTRRVLTLENVLAIKITDYEDITAAGIDRAEVASTLFDIYLKQIFEDGFFHADPHPGNLFVTPAPAAEGGAAGWKLTFVDFGMVGVVPDSLRGGLRDMAIGVGTRDTARMVAAYQALGMLLPGADLTLIQQADEKLFERFWGMSMSELRRITPSEMHDFARQFKDLIYSMPFQLPHNLMLLGRSMAILSGMCTGLDPEFNLWNGISPYAKKLLADEAGSNLDLWLDEIGKLVRALAALPGQVRVTLGLLERGELNVNVPEVSRQIYFLEQAVNRLMGGMVFAALLFAGVFLYLSGAVVPGYVFWGLAAAALFGSAFLARGHQPRK